MAFPRKSVSGLPVLECAEFGREVVSLEDYQGNIPLGCPYHMHKPEENQPLIMLDKNSLALHTFITGSTGSGKSNTICQLLNEVIKSKDTHFLVVEPAKGEYKKIFGNNKDIQVYGTNPKITPLLRINPFSFPATILVQEHLDRLVEIFNVCWPMYAAMPAVLKDAIETSYKEAGWNLLTSECRFEPKLYPTFTDIANNIRAIIESSEYSDDNKGNYKGSLITRLKSLTNGINGMIFAADELSAEELFDKNVIVDLSRVGSTETKALSMGLLVMKLQEYRMTGGSMNANLQHITVLEEAHNLLKRTSTEQSSESANLLGKSVEMLANAIAEMRTYGEGFIIADQAPGLLDMSVIRNTNTNTKIILRLPDETDKRLVGKAANLNNDQIEELAHLPCGVAAVYQNNWIQPVLCKVNHDNETPNSQYKQKDVQHDKPIFDKNTNDELIKRITRFILANVLNEQTNENIDSLQEQIIHAPFESSLKAKLLSIILDKKKRGIHETAPLISRLFENSHEVLVKSERLMSNGNLAYWTRYLKEHLAPSIQDFPYNHRVVILQCIIEDNYRNSKYLKDFPGKWYGFIRSNGGLI
jgi:DNA helicase HerA-like ATPase